MPRINMRRRVNAERDLAERIKYERERRGWSPAELARAMTQVGCSIATSAIYKIEDDEKPRKISVDELVAAAEVFEVEVAELMVPVEKVRQGKAREVAAQLDAANDKLISALGDLVDSYVQLFRIVAEDDLELFEYAQNLHLATGRQQLRPENVGLDTPLLVGITDEGDEVPVDDAELRGAVMALHKAVISLSGNHIIPEMPTKEIEDNGEHQEA